MTELHAERVALDEQYIRDPSAHAHVAPIPLHHDVGLTGSAKRFVVRFDLNGFLNGRELLEQRLTAEQLRRCFEECRESGKVAANVVGIKQAVVVELDDDRFEDVNVVAGIELVVHAQSEDSASRMVPPRELLDHTLAALTRLVPSAAFTVADSEWQNDDAPAWEMPPVEGAPVEVFIEASGSDAYGAAPRFAKVMVDLAFVRRLEKLAHVCKANGIAGLHVIDGPDAWDGDADMRLEVPSLHVDSGSFYYTAGLKHSDEQVETNYQSIAGLRDACKDAYAANRERPRVYLASIPGDLQADVEDDEAAAQDAAERSDKSTATRERAA